MSAHPVCEYLARMRTGDREAAAAFVTTFGARIRRRVRGKLDPGMRRIFDSLDVLSTLGRRLDRYVEAGRVAAATEAELWSLVFTMADNAIVDKARIFRRLKKVEGPDTTFAYELAARLRHAERREIHGAAIEIAEFIESIRDPLDQRIAARWLDGASHAAIAAEIGLTQELVRKRWERIRQAAQQRFNGAGSDA